MMRKKIFEISSWTDTNK